MPSKLKSDSYDESFDLEQYDREGGNEDSQRIKRDDISGMRREIGNLEVSQNIARKQTLVGIVCLLLVGISTLGLLSYVVISQMITSDRSGVVTKCEDGWVSDGDLLGMGCLWFEKLPMNYTKARIICNDMDAHMVEVHTRAQFSFLRGILESIGGSTWWGGASDEISEGTWLWENSETTVQNWIWASQGSQPSGDTKENALCFHGPFDYYAADWILGGVGDGVVCQKDGDSTTMSELSDLDHSKNPSTSNDIPGP